MTGFENRAKNSSGFSSAACSTTTVSYLANWRICVPYITFGDLSTDGQIFMRNAGQPNISVNHACHLVRRNFSEFILKINSIYS